MDANGKKIMITTGGGIGDNIMFTPALRRLKELYPSVHITFLTRYPNHRLLEGLPYIDKLIYIRRGMAFSRLSVIPHLFGLDALVMTDWQPQTLLFAKLLGVSLRAGYPRDGHAFSKYLTKHITPFVMTSPDFAAETNAKVFSDALEIHIDGDMTKTEVGRATEREIESAGTLLRKIGVESGYIAFCPFSSEQPKDLPLKTALEIAKQLEKRYTMPVVWIGTNSATESVNVAHNLIAQTTVGELLALIQRAKCLVSVDTGPMHIGATSISAWAPKNIVAVNCDDNQAFQRVNRDEALYKEQGIARMAAVKGKQVLDAVERVFIGHARSTCREEADDE